jgi:hypothetical protein
MPVIHPHEEELNLQFLAGTASKTTALSQNKEASQRRRNFAWNGGLGATSRGEIGGEELGNSLPKVVFRERGMACAEAEIPLRTGS